MDEKRFRLTEAEREAVIQRLVEALQAEPSVWGAWLHGSFLEGRPFHDIDIAIYVSPDSPAASAPLPLVLDLGDRLERVVRLPVDVRVLNRAPLSFQFHATAGRPLLLRNPEACHRFVEQVRRVYGDFEPMIRQHLRDVLAMNPVDPDVIRTKAAAIRRNIARVRALVNLPDEQFWADERNIEVIKLWLIQLVQDAADLCNHLAARLLNEAPSSYPECFELLGKAQILDKPLTDNLRQMARFRNLLVHRYWDVDDHQVLQIARTHLVDLEQFLQAIGKVTGIVVE